MLVRTMRVRIAASDAPIVSAGNTRLRQLPAPETGSRSSRMAKSRMSIGPSAKFGTERPSRLTKPSARSSQRLRRVAERTPAGMERSEEHTSELQSHHDLVCRLLLEKKK